MNIGGGSYARQNPDDYRRDLENQIQEQRSRRRRKDEIAPKIGQEGPTQDPFSSTYGRPPPAPAAPPYGVDPNDAKSRLREQERAYRNFGIFDASAPAPPPQAPAPYVDSFSRPRPDSDPYRYGAAAAPPPPQPTRPPYDNEFRPPYQPAPAYGSNPWDPPPGPGLPPGFGAPPPAPSGASRRDEMYEQRRREFSRRNVEVNQSWPQPPPPQRGPDPMMGSFRPDELTRSFPSAAVARSLAAEEFAAARASYPTPSWLSQPAPPPPEPSWPAAAGGGGGGGGGGGQYGSPPPAFGGAGGASLEEERKRMYQRDLEMQMKEKEDRKKRQQMEERMRQQKEEREAADFNPWGRPGAGAPMRNPHTGRVVTKLNDLHSIGESTSPRSLPMGNGAGSVNLTLSASGDLSSSSAFGKMAPAVLPGPHGGISEQYNPLNHASGENRTQQRLDTMDPNARDDMLRRQRQQQELQEDLKRQIEEKERAKRAQLEAEKAAEAAEEERLRKEREQLRQSAILEAEKKKKKAEEAAAATTAAAAAVTSSPSSNGGPLARRNRKIIDWEPPAVQAPTQQDQRVAVAGQAAVPAPPFATSASPPQARAYQPPPPPPAVGSSTQLDPRFAQQTLEALEQVKSELKAEQDHLRGLLEAEQRQLREAMAKHDQMVNTLQTQARQVMANEQRALAEVDAFKTAVAMRERALDEKERELQLLKARAETVEEFNKLKYERANKAFLERYPDPVTTEGTDLEEQQRALLEEEMNELTRMQRKEQQIQQARSRMEPTSRFSEGLATPSGPERVSSADILYDRSVMRLSALEELHNNMERGNKSEVNRLLGDFLAQRDGDVSDVQKKQPRLQADSRFIPMSL